MKIPNVVKSAYPFLFTGKYYLEYYTTFSYTEGNVLHNNVTYTSDEVKTPITVSNQLETAEGKGTADGTVANRIRIEKVDKDDPDKHLSGVSFEVKNAAGETFTITTDGEGIALSQYLAQGTYTVKEVSTAAGYDLDTKEYTVEVSADGETLKVQNERTKIDIKVDKEWIGQEGQSVTVNLFADGQPAGSKTISANDNWSVTFENMLKYQDDGTTEIEYTVREDTVDGYISEVTGNASEGFVVTNTETIDFSITKTWVGTPTDSVTVHIFADEEEIESYELSEDNDWTVEMTSLPKYNPDKSEIVYSVTEDEVDGYTSKITGDTEDGFTVINTKKPTVPNTSEEDPKKPNTPKDPEPKKPVVPNTSDSTDLPLYLALLLGAVGIAGLVYTKRKQHN